MTFNDEGLARAVAACPLPVVTGIGHEPDNSICDMVSDRRCSTPTAAAESVAPEFSELLNALSTREQRLRRSFAQTVAASLAELEGLSGLLTRAMSSRLDRMATAVEGYASRPCLVDPAHVVERRRFELAQTEDRFYMACDRSRERFTSELSQMAPRLAASSSALTRRHHALDLAASRLRSRGGQLLSGPMAEVGKSAAALDALSPLKVLARGYSIAYDDDGRVATSAGSFAPGDGLRVRMADGDVRARVDEVSLAPQPGNGE